MAWTVQAQLIQVGECIGPINGLTDAVDPTESQPHQGLTRFGQLLQQQCEFLEKRGDNNTSRTGDQQQQPNDAEQQGQGPLHRPPLAKNAHQRAQGHGQNNCCEDQQQQLTQRPQQDDGCNEGCQ